MKKVPSYFANGKWLGLKSTSIFVLLSLELTAQSIPQQVRTYAEQFRESRSVAMPAMLKEQKFAEEVIEAASVFFRDTIPFVRGQMYALVAQAGANAKEHGLRQQTVRKLANASSDWENLDVLIGQLARFDPGDFSPAATDTLALLFRKNPPYHDQLARLCGVLGIVELRDDLKALSGPATKNQRLRWAALLALARMGDKEALNGIMKRVQRLPVNDDVVYEVFPDLIYTLQRPAIDYLIVELNSDEKKCSTADDTPVTCAYRIMEMLAEAVEKYPLQTDVSGDIKSKDYEKSLTTVRQWFNKNRDYQIRILGN